MKKLILFLMIEIGVVSIYAAKPRIHYGRCNVSGLGGYCVDERTCDLSGIDTQSWPVYSTSCKDIESSSTLLCCPTTKPPSRTIPSTPPRTTVTQPTRTFSRSTTELPLPPKCGTYLADKITGGTNTTLTEFPWMAVLRYTYDDVHFLNKCGGTLISERWVLTAAHCVHNQEALTGLKLHTVRLGEWDLNNAEDCINYKSGVQCVHHQDIEVSAVIPHPAYTGLGSRFVNDIALVKLKESAQFARNVEPICLPEPVSAQPYVDIDFAHRRMDISGWGLTEAGGSQSAVKLKATLTVWSPNDCTTSINEVARSYSRQTVNTQFCASGDAGQSSCRGDSGGPIMGEKYKNRNPYYYIYGIISYGVTAECSSNKYPVIFTRVDTFVTWIRNVIATDDR